jgi:hypothetical protein
MTRCSVAAQLKDEGLDNFRKVFSEEFEAVISADSTLGVPITGGLRMTRIHVVPSTQVRRAAAAAPAAAPAAARRRLVHQARHYAHA